MVRTRPRALSPLWSICAADGRDKLLLQWIPTADRGAERRHLRRQAVPASRPRRCGCSLACRSTIRLPVNLGLISARSGG